MSDAHRTTNKWDAETVIGNVSDWTPKESQPRPEVSDKSFRSAEPGATTIMDMAEVMATHARPKSAFDTVTVVLEPQRPEPMVLVPQPAGSASTSARGPRYARLRRFAELCRDDFRRTPRSMRATLMALPIIAWATLAMTGADSEASPGVARAAQGSKPPQQVEARPSVSAAPAAKPLAPEHPARSSASVLAPAASTAGSKPGKGRSLEATAVDAAARGDHAKAAALYDELAAQYPERPEFRSAARILGGRQDVR